MPEIPDFDQIATTLLRPMDDDGVSPQWLAEQLRLVWNARGAADLNAYKSVGNSWPGAIIDALRRLDR